MMPHRPHGAVPKSRHAPDAESGEQARIIERTRLLGDGGHTPSPAG